ncbi:MAG: hypothetical protein ABR573_05940 [Candidatus Dormibacteria bacterium]
MAGSLSTIVVGGSTAKRLASAAAIIQYEADKVKASTFASAAPPYSDCFATETATTPAAAATVGGTTYQQTCATGYSLRADVTRNADIVSGSLQSWTIVARQYPAATQVGQSVTVYKDNRK